MISRDEKQIDMGFIREMDREHRAIARLKQDGINAMCDFLGKMWDFARSTEERVLIQALKDKVKEWEKGGSHGNMEHA